MPDPSIIVGVVRQVDPPSAHPEGAGFETGSIRRAVYFAKRIVYLDSHSPICANAMVLARLPRRQPLWVQVKSRGTYDGIVRALLPVVTDVRRVTPLPGGGVEVDLEASSARHILRASTADFRD